MASPGAAMDGEEPPNSGKERRVLVTFDVDGTLMRSTGGPSSNRLHRQAFSHAFLCVFGVPDATIDVMKHHGQTDPIILVKTLVHYGISYDVDFHYPWVGVLRRVLENYATLAPKHRFGTWIYRKMKDPKESVISNISILATEKLPDLKSSMISYARENVKDVGEGLEVLPGVASLLEALSQRENVAIGLGWAAISLHPCQVLCKLLETADQRQATGHLVPAISVLQCVVVSPTEYASATSVLDKVTGNLEDIAWMKMEGLGILKYFTTPNFGGFGSDHSDRGELVKVAADRAVKLFPGGFDLRVHVGDTPNDIKAAEHGGALAVGVCTGIFSKEELREASRGDAVILSDLTDTDAFLSLFGIKK